LTAIFVSFSFFEEGERLSNSWSSHCARTAFDFRNTVRIFADKFALRFRTVRLVTFPIALGFFTNGLTFGLRSLAVSNTVRLLADSDTFRAIE
jgi:hypothetical protein